MDEAMKRAVRMTLAALTSLAVPALLYAGLGLGLGLAGAARAQAITDPTQPPPEAMTTPSSSAPAAPVAHGPQLQSVLIGEHGREVAVIDGQTVRVGQKIDGAVLVRVGKNEAVLQRGAVRQVLHLFPVPAADDKTAGATTPAHNSRD
ncbi:hypothetical protein [Rugamonas sp.]|uniref:hypothetical protein n=1 Tax=Rugamonas sp. TaxID=1926287 RepID=UPI0025D4E9FD|nr:hypothetical protein [Rugamonas sp.]